MVDTTTQQEIIARLFEKLRAGYLIPDAIEGIISAIQKHLNNGEYADISEDVFFAYALTTHLQEVSHDEHLWVKYHPEVLPDSDNPSYKNKEWLERQKQQAQSEHYGIHKVEIVPAGVAVIDFRHLPRPEWAGSAIRHAFARVAAAPALILDLRNCLGGYPGTVALLCSYLLPEPALPILRVYWRDEDRTQEFRTQPSRPKQSFLEKPVYVLISKDTFSAGEALARVLQSHQRATLVGARTDGGSHAIVTYRLHPHFELSLPIGRTFDALTGEEWEGRGVTPDMECLPEQALQVALDLALHKPTPFV